MIKSSKSLYSKYFQEYVITGEQRLKLQEVLLEMFLDFKNICDDNGIQYLMSGGSLLGTIRHQGFIPWDDDIDVMMLRSEFNKLKNHFNKSLGEKYELVEPLSHSKYFGKMPKIYKRETSFIEIPSAGIGAFDMIFMDIFVIENIPKNQLIAKLRGGVYNLSHKASSVCIDYLYPSPIIEEKAQEFIEVRKYYHLRKFLGKVFSILGGVQFYLAICNSLANYSRATGYLGVPSAIGYNREVFPEKVFTDVTTAVFCGYDVNIPVHYDKYLKNLYGDYMQIPSESDREFHVAYKMEFQNKGEL